MLNINYISETFYNCCNIPIKAISKEYNEIYKFGYNDYLDQLHPKDKINDFILNEMNSNKDIYTVSIDNEIQYIITDACNVLFILGPISTNPSNKLVCYKPATCFEYIECMLCKIIENNLIYDVNSRSYNIYVRKAIHYIHKYYHEDISIDDLCEKLNINKSYFCNLFKKSTSQTFSNFLNYFRVEKSKKLLEDPKLSLLEVALDVGFTNQNYYTIVFKKITKQTPSAYRKAMVSLKNQVY
ncbi:MAG TPA: hypothetical protein DDY58_08650 [Terrisporobacter glycolicus]|uniref:helix-turn-helix domain-containing protein n=1 Tax=Terrisporobacter TaxID=1505652 RepID=UPI000E9F3D9C|nr:MULTISPECIES: AraC family transcriptional regulator [Terrisporobacter]HBI92485.1 hypothetical protein [Terrisporobacter hibernicus]